MNVFILNTGRCGSTTFIRACLHIRNFSAAHESRSAIPGEQHFEYPPWHIEADNRLAWFLGRLDDRFGDNAHYVHLKRNTQDTATSFTRRYSRGIMKAYRGEGILMGASDSLDPLTIAMDYCHTVDRNIALFLKDKTHKLTVNLESMSEDFPRFWRFICAEGDLEMALSEFSRRYNATETDPPVSSPGHLSALTTKLKDLF